MKKSPSDILSILLKPIAENTTCTVPPHNISHNVSFLLDTSGLESKNDWKCDDMGSWKNNGVQRIQLALRPDGDIVPVDNPNEGYTLKRTYFKNNSSPDLRKIVSFLPGGSCQLTIYSVYYIYIYIGYFKNYILFHNLHV